MDTTATSRFFGPVPKLTRSRSAFGGSRQHDRMGQIRKYIEIVRSGWLSEQTYKSMIETVKQFCTEQNPPAGIITSLNKLFDGFRDYADTVTPRPHHPERFDALELYCTNQGYDYLFRFMSEALRTEDTSHQQLLTATILVEFVTIDLYNLRLSQIGDPRYSNFCGITYRGLFVETSAVEEYRQILEQPDLSKRGFAVPLALVSSSSDAAVIPKFAISKHSSCGVCMLWEIHIHGIDPDLLYVYQRRYPESVVSSICAMPVGRISAFSEKEILLRGVFLQLIAMEDVTIGGSEAVKLVLVACNANRDHTTETASANEEKRLQRETFAQMVQASKYEVCASVAEKYSSQDAEAYAMLQKQSIEAIKTADFSAAIQNRLLADARPEKTAVWLGGSQCRSYPQTYAALRMQWQDAISQGDWLKAERLLAQEYSWRRSEWFNLGELSEGDEQDPSTHNRTLLHYLVLLQPVDMNDDPSCVAWERLMEEAASESVWKSVRSYDRHLQTAHDLAIENKSFQIAEKLRVFKRHDIDENLLAHIECQLHSIMTQKVGPLLQEHSFLMPQLSILPEMEVPRLWIPIPAMYGGFLVVLEEHAVQLTIFETRQGHVQPSLTKIMLQGI